MNADIYYTRYFVIVGIIEKVLIYRRIYNQTYVCTSMFLFFFPASKVRLYQSLT